MPFLTLRLLGPLQIVLAGETVTRFRSAKMPALLAYLAVESGRPHRREVLAGRLWPEKPDAAALNNLRYTLSQLRTTLGDREASTPFLLIRHDQIQWNREADYWLDVDEFLSGTGLPLAGSGRLAAGPLPEIKKLEAAVALYGGPFLDGFSLAGSPPLEEWVLYERERFHRLAVDALQRLALFYEARADLDQVEVFSRRSLDLEPWQEEAHRRLMRLLAQRGQRGAALAQYEICRARLAEELGIEPEPETRALYDRIRDGDSGLELGKPVEQISPPPRAGAPFVGREEELAGLDGFLDQALAGQGQVALVTGSAGSGKTALVSEFLARAMARNSNPVGVIATCSALSGIGDPYLVFRELLQTLAGQVEPGRAGGVVSPEHARRLWRLLPAVVQALIEAAPHLIGRFVPPEPLALRVETCTPGGAVLRARLEELVQRRGAESPQAHLQETIFEEVTRFLHVLADRQPLILVLDDLQWIDENSAALLFHLGRRLVGSHILLIGTYRPAEVARRRDGTHHPLRPVVDELRRNLGSMEVDLDRAEGRRFVEAFLDAEPNELGAAFRDRLYHTTEGHALFTIELVSEMQERGGLVRNAVGRWTEGQALDWAHLSSRVEAVIAGHVSRLPAAWQRTLAVASVEGEVFTAEVVARVQGLDIREVLHCLSGRLARRHNLVVAHGLERLDGQTLSRYRFRHHMFQVYLYRRLDAAERAHLHEAVGLALEDLHKNKASALLELAPRLAFHFEEAGLLDRTVTYLQQAGQQAYYLSACEESMILYRRALAMLKTLPPSDERDRREMALQLALTEPCQLVRGWGSPEQVEAVTRACELGWRLGEPDKLLPALLSMARSLLGEGKYRQALDIARRAGDMAHDTKNMPYLAGAHLHMGASHYLLGELIPARDELQRAVDLWRVGSDAPGASPAQRAAAMEAAPLQLPKARMWSCQVLWMLGYADRALIHSQVALAHELKLAGESIPPRERLQVKLNAELSFHACRGEAPAVEAASERMLNLLDKEGPTPFQAYARCYLGWARARQGQAAEGIGQMRTGLAALDAGGLIVGLPFLMALLAEAYLCAGQPEKGLPVIDRALSLAEQWEARSSVAEMHRLRGELLRAKGENQAAEACFGQAIEVARGQQAKAWELRATISLARLWQGQGRGPEAGALLAEVYAWFTEGFDTPDMVAARVLLEELGANALS